jgi:hypothetical protein
MKLQIISLFLILSFISCDVTLTTVAAGTCSSSTYTFTITGTTDDAVAAESVDVTLSAPTGVTPTCTIAAVTAPATGQTSPATVSCTISNANLSAATITVSAVAAPSGATNTYVALAQGGLTMSGTATCPTNDGSGGNTNTNTNGNTSSSQVTKISSFLLMILYLVF